MRRAIEVALRGIALLALALLLWRQWPSAQVKDAAPPVVVLPASDVATDSTGRATVARMLPELLRAVRENDSAWPRLHFRLTGVPARAARGVLASAASAAVPIAWTDSTRARGLAIDASSTVGPDDRVTLLASGAPGSIVLRDAGGVLDSLVLSIPATGLLIRRTGSAMEARAATSRASIGAPADVIVRRLLVYARPGWEAKFTIAALEEVGWRVDASLPVAPRASVTVGVPLPPDTARYAAVIVLDSGLVRASTVMRFAQQGGGVVLSGDALLDRSLAGIVSVRVFGMRAAVPGGLLSPQPGSGLEAVRMSPNADAVVLHRDAGFAPSVIVQRFGSGRALAAAYRESWHWRMEGSMDGKSAHRAWWAGLVRAVAYGPVARYDSSGAIGAQLADAAPYADLVAHLGRGVPMPMNASRVASAPIDQHVDALLLMVALVTLLAEWTSRRLRGAR